jgi:hypothetical protein
MLDSLSVGVRRFASGWPFWALVLLALPNCTLDRSGIALPSHVTRGPLPRGSAIMCDIEKYQGPTRRCATAQDLAIGIPLTMAAEAMVSGQTSNVGLDYSPAAQTACGAGNPQAIDFQGSFPDGFTVCLNCGVIPTAHADATAVCVAECQDQVEYGEAPFPPDALAFCTANARPSTYFPASGCFDNACSSAGTLRSDFADPRRIPEAVVWRDLIGTTAVGSNLTQASSTTMGDVFAAGAVSEQWVHANDAYLEFEASETNLSHIAGFAQVSGACPFPCTDSTPGFADIAFALSLNFNGGVYIVESGTLVPGPEVAPGIEQSFGTYTAGERFRVRVKDHFDGTATVSYTRVVGACVPGNPCNETVIFSHMTPSAVYPLRGAAAFREQNATLASVNIVRIP